MAPKQLIRTNQISHSNNCINEPDKNVIQNQLNKTPMLIRHTDHVWANINSLGIQVSQMQIY